MRLIDADATLETITGLTEQVTGEGAATAKALIFAALKSKSIIPTVGGWISVKDRLPKDQSPVLVYVPPYSDEDEEYIGYVGMAYYTYSARGGYWAGTNGAVYGAIGIILKPSYWMPLPEPPVE